MDTCAQPTISAGSPCSENDEIAHVFGSFSPFSPWGYVSRWHWGGGAEPERLYAIRFDVRSQLLTGAAERSPSDKPKTLPTSSSAGPLRLRVCATRVGGRLSTEFFVDAMGVDVYAQHVLVELWAPAGVGLAENVPAATAGPGDQGVLEAIYAPSVTRIGSSLRGVGTLHTYAEAGVPLSVPPRAVRYAVLSGEPPTLTAQGISMADAPAEGPVGGGETIRVAARSVIAWEVAP